MAILSFVRLVEPKTDLLYVTMQTEIDVKYSDILHACSGLTICLLGIWFQDDEHLLSYISFIGSFKF